MKEITEFLKGVLEGCVLEIIGQGETYGYEITQKLRELGFEDVVEGTVYTITMRLEKREWLEEEDIAQNGEQKEPETVNPPTDQNPAENEQPVTDQAQPDQTSVNPDRKSVV